jgi:hypothetical protein
MSYTTSLTSRREQHLLGKQREDQFFDAFYKHPVSLSRDVYKVVRATAQEDADGVDGWAHTAYGRIPLQLTSSRLCVHTHRTKRPTSDAIMLVVYETETPAQIQAKVCRHLEHRLKRLKKREVLARW